jgi:hypothetical protein
MRGAMTKGRKRDRSTGFPLCTRCLASDRHEAGSGAAIDTFGHFSDDGEMGVIERETGWKTLLFLFF